jgi:beta-galactosidase
MQVHDPSEVKDREQKMDDKFIPIAVWYTGGRTRATMVRPPGPDARESWKRDLQNIAACGFNTVRCWVDWASGEPQPGDYHFEALDLLMELAGDVGLRVIVQLYLDSAPDWLVKHYPDCRYVSAGGVPIDSQGAPGYCYDHPGVRAAAERFMRTLAGHVTDRKPFLAWDLWSEPHIVQWGYFDFLPQPAAFCYCHYTTQRFRDWLQRRYPDLDALNRAWYRKFSSWDLVLPPKFISLMTYTEYVDWLEFILDKLAEDLRWRHETVRQADHHPTTSHSAVPSILSLPIDEQGSPDDWRMARQVDVWGTSLYPKHVGARETHDPSFRAAMLAGTRSACDSVGAPYWLGELQGGHGYVGMFASHMTAADARSYAWQPIAHGAKGLCFYAWHPMSSGYESAGFGLANLDGTPSERAVAAGAVAQVVTENMDVLRAAKPTRARAAICWNVLSNIMWVCMRQPQHYIPICSYVGAYRALYQEHIPADFVHVDQIANGKLQDYDLLCLPFSFMMSQTAATHIEEFVREGGVVVAEARTAWNNERGYCGEAVPGLGLEQVFGCRERGTQGVPEDVAVPMRITRDHAALPLLSRGDVLTGARFQEELEVLSETADVVGEFENGAPAIVANRYGRGWAVFVGTMLSFAFYTTQDENSGRLLKGLARLAGIEPPVEVDGIPIGLDIEPRLLEGKDEEGHPFYVFFALNHTDRPTQPQFRIAAPQGDYTATDIVTGRSVPCRHRDGRLVLGKPLEPEEIWVVKIV